MQARSLRQIAPAAAVGAVFCAIAALWASGNRPVYYAVVNLWQFQTYLFPFLDGEYVVSSVRCLHRGIDVYVSNPCDVHEGTPFDYPPLWGLLGYVPLGANAGLWFSLLSVATFVASLVLLPAARTTAACLLVVLTVLSGYVAFAVERANNEILVFAAAAAGAAAVARSDAWRTAGYGLIYLAGLMKYFPLIGMLAALREGRRMFLLLAGASLAITLPLAAFWHEDIAKSLRAVPIGELTGYTFGSDIVAATIAQVAGLPPDAATALRMAMILCALAAGIVAGTKLPLRDAVAALDRREQAFLLIGALISVGLFFAMRNNLYRAIHLVLAYPSLVALAGQGRLGWRGAGIWLVPALLWWDVLGTLLQAGSDLAGIPWSGFLFPVQWQLREIFWWWLMVILVAVATALLADSPVLRGWRWPATWRRVAIGTSAGYGAGKSGGRNTG